MKGDTFTMAAIHELTRRNVSVQRAMDFEDLVAAARILVRVHETEGLGIGVRWRWRIIPVLYRQQRTCVVCHGAWPCWRARWAASTLSTLDGVWREITGEDLASEYGYSQATDEFDMRDQPEYHQAALDETGFERRAG